MNSTAPLLDAAVIDDLVEYIGFSAVRPVFDLFRGDCHSLVARIAGAQSDAAGREIVRRAAHSLKSGSGQLGAAALSAAAARVEEAASSDNPALPHDIAALQRCAEETQAVLTEWLARDHDRT